MSKFDDLDGAELDDLEKLASQGVRVTKSDVAAVKAKDRTQEKPERRPLNPTTTPAGREPLSERTNFEPLQVTPASIPPPFIPAASAQSAPQAVQFTGDFGRFLDDVGVWVDYLLPGEKGRLFRGVIAQMAVNRNLVKK
jgi:hypothetical protein